MDTDVCKFLNFLRPRSAKHERLTVGPNLADYLSDLWLKTHVKHAVCFVHDQVRNATEVRLLRF
jgi:hypothetical protein